MMTNARLKTLGVITAVLLGSTVYAANTKSKKDFTHLINTASSEEQAMKESFAQTLKEEAPTQKVGSPDVIQFLDAEIHWKKSSRAAKR